MRIFLFIVVLLFSASAFGQAIQRSPWTTNVNGTTIPDGSVTRLTEVGTKTNQVDGGGASGRFLSENLAGALSGIFADRYRYTGGNIVASNWLALPGSGAYDFSIGLNVMDPDEELMHPVWSYTNLSSDATFRFWKPVAIPNLSVSPFAANAVGQTSDGTLVKVANVGASQLSYALAVDDFSTYDTASLASARVLSGGSGWTENGFVNATNQLVSRVCQDGITRTVLEINGKGDYIRKFPFNTNFFRARIVVLWGITNSGATFTNTFVIGVTSGTNAGFHGGNVGNSFGSGNLNTTMTFAYSNALEAPYYDMVFWRGVHKTNATTTGGISMTSSSGRGVAALPNFSAVHCDITRNTGSNFPLTNDTWTFGFRQPNFQGPAQTASLTVLDAYPVTANAIYDAQATSTSTMAPTVDTSTTTVAQPLNTGNFGQVPYVCVSWGGGDELIQIMSVVVYKIH